MTELTNGLLRSATPQELAAILPAPVWIDGCAAVVVRMLDTVLVEVYLADHVTSYSTQLLYVEPLTDPVRSREVLGEAMTFMALWRQAAIDKTAELTQAHADRLDAIRTYAIERHEDGDICRDGLNRFLLHFDLAPYRTRVQVSYTITGSYEVEDSSETEAGDDAEKYLRPDLTDLDRVDDYSTSFDLSYVASEV